jgi:hypothetical protein
LVPAGRARFQTLLTRNVVAEKILKFLDAVSPLPYTALENFFDESDPLQLKPS